MVVEGEEAIISHFIQILYEISDEIGAVKKSAMKITRVFKHNQKGMINKLLILAGPTNHHKTIQTACSVLYFVRNAPTWDFAFAGKIRKSELLIHQSDVFWIKLQIL